MKSAIILCVTFMVVATSSTIIQPANYRVYLDNCGPRARALAPICAPTVTTAPIQSPPCTLPYVVPRPRTVANSCKCVKTLVKPQVVQQVITVPIIKKFVQTLARPTYQTISYTADPINCPKIEGYAPF